MTAGSSARRAAHQFADDWIMCWNAHDLETILAHYEPDIVFTSPYARLLVPGSNGRMRGLPAVRAYWEEGLRRTPALRFALLDVLLTAEGLTVLYRNQDDQLVAETMLLSARRRIVHATASYSPAPDWPETGG